ncbi:hypothetical protein HDV05_005763 [Chytridiales sp. JEL 0842]|nr:hypothetical protein HDV05_005763 [Chytridiales sp. JEL 0842]
MDTPSQPHCELEMDSSDKDDSMGIQQPVDQEERFVDQPSSPSFNARGRSRRGAAALARQIIAQESEVKKRRGKPSATHSLPVDHLNVPSTGSERKRKAVHIDDMTSLGAADKTIGFMCGDSLPSDPNALNAHIDRCLSGPSQPGSSYSSASISPAITLRKRGKGKRKAVARDSPEFDEGSGHMFEEYTWAGQTRIRATALVEGDYQANGYIVNRKTDKDTDEDIDIDNDDEVQYGTTQYTEAHLQEMAAGGISGDCPGEKQNSSDEKELVQYLKTIPPDSKLIIEALTARLRSLEKESKAPIPKCLICLDPYKTPVTSIVYQFTSGIPPSPLPDHRTYTPETEPEPLIPEDEDPEEALREAEFNAIWGENGSARAAASPTHQHYSSPSPPLVGTSQSASVLGSKPPSRASKLIQGSNASIPASEADRAVGSRGSVGMRSSAGGKIGGGSHGGGSTPDMSTDRSSVFVAAPSAFDMGGVETTSGRPSVSRMLGGLAGLSVHGSKTQLVEEQQSTTTAKKEQQQANTNSTVYVEEPGKYLEENVFPTLLPGIERLLRNVKRKDGGQVEEIGDPIQWLAQYLVQHNPNPQKTELADLADQLDAEAEAQNLQSLAPA